MSRENARRVLCCMQVALSSTAWLTGADIPVWKILKICVVCSDSIGLILALPRANVALIRSPFAELFQILRSWENYWVQLDSPRAQGHVLSGSKIPMRLLNSVIPHQLTLLLITHLLTLE